MFRIFIPIYLLLLGYGLLAEDIAEALVIEFTTSALEQDTIDDFSGIFAFTEEVLLDTPIEQWPEALTTLSSKNIPAAVSPLSDFDSDNHAQAQMALGKGWYDAEQDIIYQRLGKSGWVLHFGPVDTIDEMKASEFLASISGTILLIATIVIWTFTVRRRIDLLEKSASMFGQGNLSERVSENSRVKLSNLNRHFNLMADRIQELIESSRHLSNAVAHELRSPLNRIQFELEYMKDTGVDHEQQNAIASIEEDLQVLELLVDEMLTYAKYERQSLSVNLQPIEITSWLTDWYQNYEFMTSCLHRLSIDGNKTLVLVEHHGLSRALRNLVSNAEKYANQLVLVSYGSDERNIYIAVEDDGEGISEGDRHHLFEPFTRVDNSRNRTTGGYGMGLAIVAKIIERHKGKVLIDDSVLGGAKFVIQLPVSVAN